MRKRSVAPGMRPAALSGSPSATGCSPHWRAAMTSSDRTSEADLAWGINVRSVGLVLSPAFPCHRSAREAFSHHYVARRIREGLPRLLYLQGHENELLSCGILDTLAVTGSADKVLRPFVLGDRVGIVSHFQPPSSDHTTDGAGVVDQPRQMPAPAAAPAAGLVRPALVSRSDPPRRVPMAAASGRRCSFFSKSAGSVSSRCRGAGSIGCIMFLVARRRAGTEVGLERRLPTPRTPKEAAAATCCRRRRCCCCCPLVFFVSSGTRVPSGTSGVCGPWTTAWLRWIRGRGCSGSWTSTRGRHPTSSGPPGT